MRFKLLLVFAIFLVLFSLNFVYAACQEGMVSYWKFEGNLEDSQPNNNDGKLVIGYQESTTPPTTTFKERKAGNDAIILSGAGNYVNVTDSQSLRLTGSFTIEAWVNRKSWSADAIVAKMASSYVYNKYELYMNDQLRFWHNGYLWGSANTNVPINEWHHVAVTFNKDTGIQTFYLDGKIDGSYNYGSYFNPAYDSSTLYPLYIGYDGIFVFDGLIDEVAIWKRSLSADEIRENYARSFSGNSYCQDVTVPPPIPPCQGKENQTIMKLTAEKDAKGALWNYTLASILICYNDFFSEYPEKNPHECKADNRNSVLWLNDTSDACMSQPANCPPSMVSYWRFENNSDSKDSNHGELVGEAVFAGGGISKKALDLKDNSNWKYLYIQPAENLKLTNKFTIETWINPTNIEYWKFILGSSDSSGSIYGNYILALYQGNVVLYSANGLGTPLIQSNGKVKTKEWTHIAIVSDATKCKVYINGLIDNSNSASCNIYTTYTNFKGIDIGGAANFSTWGSDSIFRGKIDDVAIYNSALSDSDIKKHYEWTSQGRDYCNEQLPCLDNFLAATTQLSDYEINICYGDLSCYAAGTGKTCNNVAGEKEIVRLQKDTESYLAKPSIDDTNYPIKICCKPYKGMVSEANWTSMSDKIISHANLSDRVKLRAGGVGMENKNINFTIYKRGDVLRAILSKITLGLVSSDTRIGAFPSKGFTTWKANEAGTYYFNASFEGVQNISNDLDVSGKEENMPPYADIISPELGKVYFLNEIINFTQNSSDEDDFIDYAWIFGDGNETRGNTQDYNIFNATYNTTHKYNTIGQKNIKLDVKDEREAIAKDRTSILICGGDVGIEDTECLFANISKPKWGEIESDKIVDFDASGSFALSYKKSTKKLACIAGRCPEKTANGTNIEPLAITDEKIYDNLKFDWTFYEQGRADKKTSYTGTGINGVKLQKRFNYDATLNNPHRAELTVTLIKPTE